MQEIRRRRGLSARVAGFAGVGLLVSVAAAFAAPVFHNGGTGACEGCHGRQERGAAAPAEEADGGTEGKGAGRMLRGSDASSTCLLCHEGGANGGREQHQVSTPGALLAPGTPPRHLTPGGDFGWLKKEFRWTSGTGSGTNEGISPGDRHGHNIVAADFGYGADRTLASAPGGTYPAQALSCTSCHDPHGTYRRGGGGEVVREGLPAGVSGSYGATPDPASLHPAGTYRLLGGKEYQPHHVQGLPVFEADPPAAVAPAIYNRSEAAGDVRVAYGSGMSEWCRNCHPRIHGSGGTLGHPAGNGAKLSPAVILTYNAYVGSGNFGGSPSSSATSLVPFEMGTDDYEVLKAAADASSAAGPDTAAGSPNVMCLTCHRAHASAWDGMTRWNTKATFIVQNGRYPGSDIPESFDSAHGRTSAETAKGYYDRPASAFAAFQRSLCNKCHGKD